MSDYYKKNMELIEKHSSDTRDLSEELPATIKVKTTPSGDNTVWLDNILIHSMYDPVKEGRAFAKKVKTGSQVCLYGFGLGYHIDPLLEKIGANGFLLAIELNPDLLLAAMMLRDHSKILCDERFHLVFGSNEEKVATEITVYMDMLQKACSGPLEVLLWCLFSSCFPVPFWELF